jgi:hypothetical protein
MQNTITVNYSEFNPANLSFTKLEENERSNGQLIGYPRFSHSGKDSTLELQLPWIKLTTYGVPTLNEKTKNYYKTDTDRAHIRLPLNTENSEISVMVEKIKAIDTMMADPENAKKLLGKNYKKYKYSPIFREAIVTQLDDGSDSDEDSKKKEVKPVSNKPAYIKLKLDLSWPDNNVKTKIFSSELNVESNKRSRTKIDVTTIDEVASVIRYLAKIRCVIKFVKAWAHPITKKDPEYGIGLKVIRVEVDKVEGSSVYKSMYESENFIDSDTEEELPQVKQAQVAEESDESDEDEPVIQTQQKIVEVESSDEEEEEEEEVKPPPPPKKTKSVSKPKSKA